MKKLTGIIIGAVLIACGVVYIFDIFGIADINFSFDGWWALFIIALADFLRTKKSLVIC